MLGVGKHSCLQSLMQHLPSNPLMHSDLNVQGASMNSKANKRVPCGTTRSSVCKAHSRELSFTS